jgi:uncharacterized membrane protein YdcZ (DUF606 family)
VAVRARHGAFSFPLDPGDGRSKFYLIFPSIFSSTYVVMVTTLSQSIPIGLLFVSTTSGMLVVATVIDHYNLSSSRHLPVSPGKLAALCLVVAGAAMTSQVHTVRSSNDGWKVAEALIPVAVGGCVPLQALFLAILAHSFKCPLRAATMNVLGNIPIVGILCVLSLLSTPLQYSEPRWFQWFGGLLGSVILSAASFIPQRLGSSAAYFFLVFMGQIVTGVFISYWGLLGQVQHAPTRIQLVGIATATVGTAMFQGICVRQSRAPLVAAKDNADSFGSISGLATAASRSVATMQCLEEDPRHYDADKDLDSATILNWSIVLDSPV